MVGEIGIVKRRRAANFNKFGRIPAVAADNRRVDSHFSGLFDDLADFFIIARYIKNFGIHRFQLGQHRFKILVFLQIGFLCYDRAAAFGKGFTEEGSQTFTIVAAVVDHDRGLFQFQRVQDKVCADGPLERVDEANPEGIVLHFFRLVIHRHFRIGCANHQERHFGRLRHAGSGNRVGTGKPACYSNHAILHCQFGHCIGSFRRLAFIIGDYGNNLFPQYATFGIGFFESHFCAIGRRGAKRCIAAGHFIQQSNFQAVGIGAFAAACQYRPHQ